LIIVYGPKLSGKSTTINKVLDKKIGVITVRFQKETTLFKEIGKILEIPDIKLNLQNINEIFKLFKKEYERCPIINIDINGEYNVLMEQWVRDGRALTEGGLGFCDYNSVFL